MAAGDEELGAGLRELRAQQETTANNLGAARRDMVALDAERARHVRSAADASACAFRAALLSDRVEAARRLAALEKRVRFLEAEALPAAEARAEARAKSVRADAEAWFRQATASVSEARRKLGDAIGRAIKVGFRGNVGFPCWPAVPPSFPRPGVGTYLVFDLPPLFALGGGSLGVSPP